MYISNFTFPSWFENLGEEVIFDNDCLQSNTKDCEKNVCSHQEKVTTHPRRRPGVRARCVVHIVTLCATKRCARGVVHIPNWFCPTWLCHHLLQLPQLELWHLRSKCLRPAWNGQMCQFGIGGKGDNFDKGALFSRSVGRGSICLTCRKQLTGTGSNSAVAFLLKHLRGHMISPRNKMIREKDNKYRNQEQLQPHRYNENDKNNTQHGLNAMALS